MLRVFSPLYEVAQMTRISDPPLQSEVRLFSAVFKHGSLTVTRRLRHTTRSESPYARARARGPVTEPEFWRKVNLVTVRGRPYSPGIGALVQEAMRKKWFGNKAIAARLLKKRR